jgi:hypothetical protein
MNYKLLFLKTGPDGVYAEVLLDTNDESRFQAVELAIKRAEQRRTDKPKFVIASPPGKQGHQVYVLSVASDSQFASMLEAFDPFQSAAALSKLLGYTYNACSMALTYAKNKGETSATLKGVEFCYEENVPGAASV